MLAAVQAGSAAHPAFGFIDAGYAITGGIASNATALGVKIVGVDTNTGRYTPTHTNIRNALHDWEYGYAQDTTSGPNYPQGLLGGFYWVTKGSSPSSFTGNRVTTQGTSAATVRMSTGNNFRARFPMTLREQCSSPARTDSRRNSVRGSHDQSGPAHCRLPLVAARRPLDAHKREQSVWRQRSLFTGRCGDFRIPLRCC